MCLLDGSYTVQFRGMQFNKLRCMRMKKSHRVCMYVSSNHTNPLSTSFADFFPMETAMRISFLTYQKGLDS